MTYNTDRAIAYLRTQNIDGERILQNGIDETGYDILVTGENGRPLYDNKGASHSLLKERKEWPSPLVYENFERLMRGEDIKVSELVKEVNEALATNKAKTQPVKGAKP